MIKDFSFPFSFFAFRTKNQFLIPFWRIQVPLFLLRHFEWLSSQLIFQSKFSNTISPEMDWEAFS